MATAKELASGLTREDLLRLLSYDRETGDLFWRVTGHAGNPTAGARAGSLHKDGYIYVKIARNRFPSHRLIWKMETGEWPAQDIDHINRVRSNNRWANLREASRRQNLLNKTRKRTHGVTGVWRDTNSSKWLACISVDRNKSVVERFSTKQEAVAWRLSQEKLHYGAFAPSARSFPPSLNR